MEERPKRLKKYIFEINSGKQNNLAVKQVLYYNDSLEDDSEQEAELKKELDIDVKIVNLWNFEQTLDQLYREENTVFIFAAIQTLQDHVIPASLEGDTLDILDIRLNECRSFWDACNLA